MFGTLGVTVFIQDTFSVQTHYSDAHKKVSPRLLPKSHQKSSQSTLVLFTPAPCFCSFRLLFYALRNSALPIFPFKFSIPALPEIRTFVSFVYGV